MIITKRTNSNDKNFQELVNALDLELSIRDGEEHLFLAELNKTDFWEYAIVAYYNDEPFGCGALCRCWCSIIGFLLAWGCSPTTQL